LDAFFAPFVGASFFFVALPLLSPSSPQFSMKSTLNHITYEKILQSENFFFHLPINACCISAPLLDGNGIKPEERALHNSLITFSFKLRVQWCPKRAEDLISLIKYLLASCLQKRSLQESTDSPCIIDGQICSHNLERLIQEGRCNGRRDYHMTFILRKLYANICRNVPPSRWPCCRRCSSNCSLSLANYWGCSWLAPEIQ
jgi:hypothetical protein